MLEEAWEVVDAIDREDAAALRERDGHLRREKTEHDRRQRVDHRRRAADVEAEPVRQKHREHRAEDIERERAEVQQHVQPPPEERVDQQLEQVHRLGVAHDAAAAEDGIRGEKAAHHGKGEMPAKIYFFQLMHIVKTVRFRQNPGKNIYQYTSFCGFRKRKSV